MRVEGTDSDGTDFTGVGRVANISSGGALLSLMKPLSKGMQVDVFIKLPMKSNNWMKYSAYVVRVEDGHTPLVAAVRFDGARPNFSPV